MRALAAAMVAFALSGCSAAPPQGPPTPAPAASSPVAAPAAPPPISTPPPAPPALKSPDPAQDRAFINAAANGDLAGVQAALAAGASLTAVDATDRTALVAAAYGNHVAVARVLVAAGADVNHKDETVQSAYHIATSEVGPNPALLRVMLAGGADLTSLDSFQGTGLIRAADRGHAEICQILVDAGIDVNHVNRLGWTALHEAIILGDGGAAYQETVRALIAGGADVNKASGRDGIRPLQHAQRLGYAKIAAQLRQAGAK